MIVYDSKKWWSALVNFKRSYIIRKTLINVLFIGLYSAVIVLLEIRYLDFELRFDTTIYSLLGIMLSLLMVFRLNSSYDKWWEGRKQWGALVNQTRGLAVFLHRMLPNNHEKDRAFFALTISNYVYSLRDHLRDHKEYEMISDYSGEDSKQLAQTIDHIPNRIVNDIQARIQQLYKQEVYDGFEFNNVRPHVQAFLDIQGACERIKATPIPYAHNFFIKLFITTYYILMPMILASTLGFYAIPVTMFVSYAMVGLEYISAEIEEPFGLDCNDLPTSYLAQKIHLNVYEIFELDQPEIRDAEPQLGDYVKIH